MSDQVFNPFLPLDTYIPDGEPHVFDDRVYLFGSHDKENGDTYCMLSYEFWSAPVDDLTQWSSNGINYSASQDPLYSARLPYMFAPDVVRGNDGRFYLYYCMAGERGRGGYGNPISVAVCDTPDGRYEYLGVVKDGTGAPLMRYVCFDPAVINDDGVIRLYYGACYGFENIKNPLTRNMLAKVEAGIFDRDAKTLLHQTDSVMGAIHVTLKDDMLTASSEPVRIMPVRTKNTQFAEHPFFEGSSIRKVNGRYYFVYSSRNNHELCYAVSRFPDRDYTYGGTIVSNGDVGLHGREPRQRLNATGTNHGGIECIRGQWYVFYHRLTHASDYSRQACAEPVTIAPDGSIAQVEITSCGLNGGPLAGCGAYPAVIACNLTNGRMPHGSNRKRKQPIPCVSSDGTERFLRGLTNNTQAVYKYFNFQDTGAVRVVLRGGAGALHILDGLDGKELVRIPVSGSEKWKTYSAALPDIKGIHALAFRWSSRKNTDFLQFELCR